MAVVTLIFVGLWFAGGGKIAIQLRSKPKALAAGLTSGITTMVAHSGGPPLAMYLLPLGLSKEIYAGTTSLFFTIGNATKAVPWLLLVKPSGQRLDIDGDLPRSPFLPAYGSVGGFTAGWTSIRFIGPATDCWS